MASSSWLKTQRSGKVSERDTLVRRKNGVDTIIRKIGSVQVIILPVLREERNPYLLILIPKRKNMIVMIRKLTLVKQIYKMNQIDVRQG